MCLRWKCGLAEAILRQFESGSDNVFPFWVVVLVLPRLEAACVGGGGLRENEVEREGRDSGGEEEKRVVNGGHFQSQKHGTATLVLDERALLVSFVTDQFKGGGLQKTPGLSSHNFSLESQETYFLAKSSMTLEELEVVSQLSQLPLKSSFCTLIGYLGSKNLHTRVFADYLPVMDQGRSNTFACMMARKQEELKKFGEGCSFCPPITAKPAIVQTPPVNLETIIVVKGKLVTLTPAPEAVAPINPSAEPQPMLVEVIDEAKGENAYL
ncbi:hypothetical protein LR48_Vigan02g165700 [Vigna angularis]|uniref:Uncharacterized protein n=1 Tax=Phaseolus angularis TaxID=3914 RepID=A0A0L9TYP7_PHAAN|nr:hypothetical protein LR48_Vigan02g165700 [Vigna angularis]